MKFDNEEDLFEFVRTHLYVAVVCDILDDMGFRQQAMHHRLRPLLSEPGSCGFIGRARTFAWIETNEIIAENPYGKEIEAMDSLGVNDVVVHSTDYNGTNAPWGELMTTLAVRKGVAGCVCDSQIRDCIRIIEMKFPVFYAGIRPLDSKGRGLVTDYDIPVYCGDVKVFAGDIVYADFDGIVVVPKQIVHEVFRRAYEKVAKENVSRSELIRGETLRSVFDKYGAL